MKTAIENLSLVALGVICIIFGPPYAPYGKIGAWFGGTVLIIVGVTRWKLERGEDK